MPITKGAIKRMRSDKKKSIRNQETLSKLKTLSKKYKVTVASKDVDASKSSARVLSAELDKAVSKGIIPKGRADRKKARVQLALNKLLSTNSDK